jgi:PKD repeat protein
MLLNSSSLQIYLSDDFGITWKTIGNPGVSCAVGGIEELEVINQSPVADFYADDTTPTTNQVVRLIDTSTNSPDTWSWKFTPSAGIQYIVGGPSSQNPQVMFTIADTYDVELTVSNIVGSDTKQRRDYIEVRQYTAPPDTDFIADKTEINVNETVQFTDLSTNNPTSWTWSVPGATENKDYQFIDPKTSQNPRIKFLIAGKFTIQLQACNAGGCNTRQKYQYITVGADLITGIVSYWKFVGGALNDELGLNDLTAYGSPAALNPGKIGQAVVCNGSTAYYNSLPNNMSHNEFTVSVWVKKLGVMGNNNGIITRIASDCVAHGPMWGIYEDDFSAEKRITFYVMDNQGAFRQAYEIAALPIGTWVHLVGVSSATEVVIYGNGSKCQFPDSPVGTIAPYNTPLYMGAQYCVQNVTPAQFFNGAIDEVGYWDRALTDAEVLALYNNGNGLQYPFA